MSGVGETRNKRFGGRGFITFLTVLAFIFLFSGCGDFVFFFSVNTGNLEGATQEGLVVIIGTPLDVEAESVRLVSGEIPAGMKPQLDGTVRGISEETGFFDFTVELAFPDQTIQTRAFEGEIGG